MVNINLGKVVSLLNTLIPSYQRPTIVKIFIPRTLYGLSSLSRVPVGVSHLFHASDYYIVDGSGACSIAWGEDAEWKELCLSCVVLRVVHPLFSSTPTPT